MFPKIKPDRVDYLRSMPALDAVRLIVSGEFIPGEDEYLIDAIWTKANVNCDEEEMWEILYAAMDNQSDPMTVLGRLAK